MSEASTTQSKNRRPRKRAPIRRLPSAALLHSLLAYNPKTGVLTWRFRPPTTKKNKSFNTAHAGKHAGGISAGREAGDNRYLIVGIRTGRYQQYQAHRIIWKMMTGAEPRDFIDHKDGDNFNNRWDNLRPTTNGTNLQNAKLRRDNASGVKGVCWDAYHKKWVAQISVRARQRRLGRFETFEAARAAIVQARRELHGAFARFK